VKHDPLRTALRGAGLRVTLQRIAVLGIVNESERPISHGEISKQLGGVGDDRSTVYRNLMDLARAGLVRRVAVGDRKWRFEPARSNPHARAHPHFICTSCGDVACLTALRVAVGRVKAPRAIELGEFEVQVRGICDVCARRS
jgi:Fur family transcriptional regulator, ferric uptake regulator